MRALFLTETLRYTAILCWDCDAYETACSVHVSTCLMVMAAAGVEPCHFGVMPVQGSGSSTHRRQIEGSEHTLPLLWPLEINFCLVLLTTFG